MIKLITSNPNFIQSEIIIISIKFSQKAIDALPNFIMFLREFNKEIVLLSRSNDYEILEAPTRTQVDIKLLEIFKNSDEFNSGHRKNLEKLMYNKRRVNEYANINIQLSELAKEFKIKYLRKQDFLCDEETKSCDALTTEGHKIFFDSNHYTLKGAKYLGEKIYKMNWFNID